MSTLREVLLFQVPPAHPRTSWRHCGARTWKHASQAPGSMMLLAYGCCCVTFMVGGGACNTYDRRTMRRAAPAPARHAVPIDFAGLRACPVAADSRPQIELRRCYC